MRKILFLLLIAVFSFGSLPGEKKYTEEEDRIKERYVDEVVNRFAQEMNEKYKLCCCGIGGSMSYDIEQIGIDFMVHQQVEIEEARELVVKATERLVEMVNASEKVRPYLIEYPWTYSRSHIMISFLKENGRKYPQGVSLIFQAKDQLFYYGPIECENGLDPTIKEETYVEAKKIVDSNPSCLKPIERKKKSFLNWLGF